MNQSKFSKLLKQIYSAVAGLERMFPGRHFTPDGHLVGSLGEAIASHYYGITLYPASHAVYDGRIKNRKVQIKATQKSSVEIKHGHGQLLVIKILTDGNFEEIYNGDGETAWRSLAHRKPTKAGEISISLRQLKILNDSVKPSKRISRVKS